MANATITPRMVREIITTDVSDGELEGLIAGALVLYRSHLGSRAVPNDLQIEMKRNLAAHMVALRDPSTRITQEKIGDAAVTYGDSPGQGTDTTGLMSTRWGQMAITLDPTGILSRLGKVPAVWYSL